MNYSIHITHAAERDLLGAADHIEYVLLDPQAANGLLDAAEAKIGELATFPEKYALVDDPVLKAWGIRFAVVKNFIMFYLVSHEERCVYIVRFLYGRRNWTTILKQGFSLQ